MRLEKVPNWGLDWGQHSRSQGGEDDGICCRGPLAEEEGPLGHGRKHCTPVAYTRFDDVLVGVPKDALYPQYLSHLPAHHPRDQRADGCGDGIEGHARVPPSLLANEMCNPIALAVFRDLVSISSVMSKPMTRPLRLAYQTGALLNSTSLLLNEALLILAVRSQFLGRYLSSQPASLPPSIRAIHLAVDEP